MKKFLFVMTAVLFIFTMSFVSCKKTDTAPANVNSDTSASVGNDHTVAIQSLSDASNSSQNNLNSSSNPTAFDMHINQIMGNNLHASGGLMDVTASGTVTGGPTQTPPTATFVNHDNGDTVTITAPVGTHPGIAKSDFGIKGMASHDGNIRKGQIISHFFHKYRDSNFVDTISFSNYTINGKAITGTIVLKRVNDTTMSHEFHTQVTATGGLITKIEGKTMRVFSAVTAAGSGLASNLKIKESGIINGTSKEGVSYTATISPSHPLVYDFSCNGLFPISGTIDFSSSFYKNDRIIDYGTGTCDKIFTIKIGSYTATIDASKTK